MAACLVPRSRTGCLARPRRHAMRRARPSRSARSIFWRIPARTSTPFHRYEQAPDIAGYSLEAVADLAGLVVRATERSARAIDVDILARLDFQGKAVLVHTGWD